MGTVRHKLKRGVVSTKEPGQAPGGGLRAMLAKYTGRSFGASIGG